MLAEYRTVASGVVAVTTCVFTGRTAFGSLACGFEHPLATVPSAAIATINFWALIGSLPLLPPARSRPWPPRNRAGPVDTGHSCQRAPLAPAARRAAALPGVGIDWS